MPSNQERGWLDGLRHMMTFDETNPGPTALGTASRRPADQPPNPDVPGALKDLVWRANHDSLTLVCNRASLLRSVDGARSVRVNSDRHHLLAIIDFDLFKRINDTWGHGAGDAVLTEIAGRLRHLCDPGDLVGRIGGDEFAFWSEDVSPERGYEYAHKILSVFDKPVRFGQMSIPVKGSVGLILTKPGDDRATSDLLNCADVALYQAKERGPGSFCIFDQFLAERITETATREQELRYAVQNDQFEFDLQPIVSSASGRQVGVEILTRWNNPRRGRLAPGEFLPLLEAMNLFAVFDALILEKALSTFVQWRSELRAPDTIWVNLSPSHLDSSFPEYVRQLLETYDVDGSHLVLELTEDAAANTPGHIAVLEAVRALGVAVAIDDFGTGYSQLAYLQDLPIDYVKLDRSFVSGFHQEPRRVAVAQSVIQLAHAIGVQVIGEGIERTEELELLQTLDCDLAQGYLLQRPGCADDILGA